MKKDRKKYNSGKKINYKNGNTVQNVVENVQTKVKKNEKLLNCFSIRKTKLFILFLLLSTKIEVELLACMCIQRGFFK